MYRKIDFYQIEIQLQPHCNYQHIHAIEITSLFFSKSFQYKLAGYYLKTPICTALLKNLI